MKTVLLAFLGLIVTPAIASAQTAGDPNPWVGISSEIRGLGNIGAPAEGFGFPPPRYQERGPDQTREPMSGKTRNCCCECTRPQAAPSEQRGETGEPNPSQPGDTSNPQR
jgi:hypothetical protein